VHYALFGDENRANTREICGNGKSNPRLYKNYHIFSPELDEDSVA
jgi:hypothetical protein